MRRTLALALVAVITIVVMSTVVSAAPPVNTGFTWQGFLKEGGVPADGTYDFEFLLFDALSAGTQVGSTDTLDDVTVTDGLFDVVIDFGGGVFDGQARWIEIHVRDGGGGAYTPLTPRRPLTAVPYAQFALNGNGSGGASVQTGQVTLEVAPGFVPETYSHEVAFSPPFAANPSIAFGLQSTSPLITSIMPYAQDMSTTGFTLTVNVAPATPFTAPANPANGGGHNSALAQVNGRPAIAYVNLDGYLTYVRALNAEGTEWGTPVIVDPVNAGGFLSFIVVNGRPAIAYQSPLDNTIYYVRATDSDGTAWGTSVSVPGTLAEPTGNVSMAIVNGNPAIAFGAGSDRILYYARADDANGATWGFADRVDPYASAAFNSYGASLAVVSGVPAISYLERQSGLKIISAGHPNGGFWQTPRDVYLQPTLFPQSFHKTSLVMVEGNPAIAATIDRELRYVRSTDIAGQNWGASILIEQLPAGSDSIGYASMEIVNGKPAIAYTHLRGATSDLKYAFSTDTAGREWELPVILTAPESAENQTGRFVSLEIINGVPAISHLEMSNPSGEASLKYTSILVRETPTITVNWTATLP